MHLRSTCTLLLALLLLPAVASAQDVIDHGEISFIELSFNNVNQSMPFWVVQINDTTSGNVYDPAPPGSASQPYVFNAPGGARFRVAGPQHLFQRPTSSEWNFIGVNGGDYFRATPQSGDAATRLIMGISTLSIPNGLFVNNRVTFTMSVVNISNPGAFSYYANDGSFNDAIGILSPPPLFSTVDNLTSIVRNSGTFNFFNMAFSTPGTYDIDFQFSGTRTPAAGGGTVESLFYRYTFEIAAVPEPATWGLIALSTLAAGGYVWMRRSRRQRMLDATVE